MGQSFLEWLKSAKGSELAYYEPKNDKENELIEAEIERRLDKNVPKLADSFFSFIEKLGE